MIVAECAVMMVSAFKLVESKRMMLGGSRPSAAALELSEVEMSRR
jgi:hypothetical protein